MILHTESGRIWSVAQSMAQSEKRLGNALWKKIHFGGSTMKNEEDVVSVEQRVELIEDGLLVEKT